MLRAKVESANPIPPTPPHPPRSPGHRHPGATHRKTRQQIEAERRAAFAASYIRPTSDPVETLRSTLHTEAHRIISAIRDEVRRQDPTVGTVVGGYRQGAAEGSYHRAAAHLGYDYRNVLLALDM